MFLKPRFVFFVFFLYSLITLSGCSNDKDTQIASLQDKIASLQDKVNSKDEEIAKLNRQVGEGKQQYEVEDEQKSTKYLKVFVLIVCVLFIAWIWRERHIHTKWTNKYEQETNKLKRKNDEQSKVIMELEHTIKKLKDSLEEGERNEVSTLIKSLKSERDLKIKKIGGLDDE